MIHNRMGTVFDGVDDPFVANELVKLLENEYTIRTDLVNTALHRLKDIEKECDYPTTANITTTDLKNMYDRNPVGSRVVEVMPMECWQSSPDILEDEDVQVTTKFEQAWEDLGRQLGSEESWYKGATSPVWEYLSRADKLSGIGHFGLILIGIDDGKRLEEPADGFQDPDNGQSGPVYITNQRKAHKLLYLSVFDEACIQTVEYENNIYSSRYRKPKYYSIDLGGNEDSSYVTAGREGRTVRVHWSRIVHIADNMDSSEIIGVPRQRPVWNNLLDLMKVYGGDAEGFWKNCVMRIYLETHPQLGGDVTIDESTLKERMWDMENGLQRWAALKGMSAKTVAPVVVDPTSHINVQIDAICIKLAIPKRIFVGSERGQLASGQDDSTWNDRIRSRQNNYCIPRIVVPFINRSVQLGILPIPAKGFKAIWPDPETLKPQEKVDIAVKRTEAMAKYIGGQVDALIDPLDYLVRVLGFEEEEAEGVLERAAESAVEEAKIAEAEEAKTPPAEEEGQEAETIAEPELVQAQLNWFVANGFLSDEQRKAVMAKLGRLGPKGGGPGQQRGPGGKFAAKAKPEEGQEKAAITGKKEKPKAAKTELPAKEESIKPVKEGLITDRLLACKRDENAAAKEDSKLSKAAKFGNPPPGVSKKGGEEAVGAYTGDEHFAQMNSNLRSGKSPKDTPPKPHTENLQKLASQELPEPTLIYRGVSGDTQKVYMGAKDGSEIRINGFVSTSVDPGTASGFADKTVLEIKAKRGLSVSSKSSYPEEMEVIQPHGTRYKVLGKREDTIYGVKLSIVMMEEL